MFSENDTFKSSAEAAKTLADLAKELTKHGKSSESVTKGDQKSSLEYNSALAATLGTGAIATKLLLDNKKS